MLSCSLLLQDADDEEGQEDEMLIADDGSNNTAETNKFDAIVGALEGGQLAPRNHWHPACLANEADAWVDWDAMLISSAS